MTLTEALTQRANADAALQALVGGNVHWVKRPQGEPLPVLMLQVISEQRPQTLDGFDDMRTARVQADMLADTYTAARAGIEAAIAALLPAAAVTSADGDVLFWDGSVEGPRDLGEQTDNGFVHRASADLIIRYAITRVTAD